MKPSFPPQKTPSAPPRLRGKNNGSKPRLAGWKMTPAQIASHWRMFAQICDALDWPQDEEHRRLWYQQSGIGRVSIKTISDPEFDKIKAFWSAAINPASVDAQLRQLNMPKTRLIHACQTLAPDPVILAIARDKFGVGTVTPCGPPDLMTLTEQQLTDLRNTLQRWSTRKAREERIAAEQEEMNAAGWRDCRGPCANCEAEKRASAEAQSNNPF